MTSPVPASPPAASSSAGLATPRGRYAQVRRAGDLLFVCGTSARRADNSIAGAEVDAMGTTRLDIRAQTRAVLDYIAAILASQGASLADGVEASVFLVNMNDFAGFNEVWAEVFTDTAAARTTVAVHQLPHPLLLIEIRAVAWRRSAAPRPWPSTPNRRRGWPWRPTARVARSCWETAHSGRSRRRCGRLSFACRRWTRRASICRSSAPRR